MSIRLFFCTVLSGSVCVACLAGSLAYSAEPVASNPTPNTKTEAATTPTAVPQAAAAPKTPTDRKAMLMQIQNDILTFRSEFNARMARAKEDRHAVSENVLGKLAELKSAHGESQTKKEQFVTDFEILRTDIEKFDEQIAALEQSVTTMESTMNERLDAVEKGAKTGHLERRPVITDVPAGKETPAEGEEEDSLNLGAGELFRLAHRYFMEKEYDVAIGGFHKFLMDFPDHQLAGAAQYWIAESFLQIGEYDVALQEYARLIKSYPRDDKVADAYYGTGVALQKQGKNEEAKQALQYVINHFSDTLAANKAQNRLKDIP